MCLDIGQDALWSPVPIFLPENGAESFLGKAFSLRLTHNLIRGVARCTKEKRDFGDMDTVCSDSQSVSFDAKLLALHIDSCAYSNRREDRHSNRKTGREKASPTPARGDWYSTGIHRSWSLAQALGSLLTGGFRTPGPTS